ncbi:hypothetical protein BgiBS90_007503 [Biomphalaria glabrata]|nr:hypothetical protein BgiBS90_007503 [Biomphalaria glabrata]
MLRIVLFALWALNVVHAQPKLEWLPEELYNPQVEPQKCGLKYNEPGFVCDPNRILGEDIHSINWHLKDAAYNGTKCPCSNFYCERDPYPAKGYHIGVALVKKMVLQKNGDGSNNSVKDQAQLFAYILENEKWKMGRCEEDIIIFYSLDDNVLSLYGGSTAIAKLSPYYRNLLIHKVASRFNEGRIVEALHNLIYNMKKVLNCDPSFENNCELHDLVSASSIMTLNLMIAVGSVLTLLFMFF